MLKSRREGGRLYIEVDIAVISLQIKIIKFQKKKVASNRFDKA